MTTTISGAGPHAAALATDRIPASKTPFTPGTKGYLTPQLIRDFVLSTAIQTVAGAVGAPGVAIGDADTGFYQTSGQLHGTLDGAEFWRVNSTGAAFGAGFDPTEALQVRRTGATVARIALEGEAGVSNQASRYSADTGGPFYSLIKARGTIASPAAPAQNDTIGTVAFIALDPTTQRTVARIQGVVIAATPSSTDMQGRIVGSVTPASSVTPTEVFRWEAGTGLSMYGANPVIDSQRRFISSAGEYTAAQIADKTHAVNTTGKVNGLEVWDTTNHRKMRAIGSTDVSVWWVVDGSASVTPA